MSNTSNKVSRPRRILNIYIETLHLSTLTWWDLLPTFRSLLDKHEPTDGRQPPKVSADYDGQRHTGGKGGQVPPQPLPRDLQQYVAVCDQCRGVTFQFIFNVDHKLAQPRRQKNATEHCHSKQVQQTSQEGQMRITFWTTLFLHQSITNYVR